MGLHAPAAAGAENAGEPPPHRPAVYGLALAALGVVYGDIGTSPLYTLQTVFDPANGLKLDPGNVIGIVSLIFWSLTVVVSLKYVTLILRANNHGEGGIMALLALAASSVASRPRLRHVLLAVGVMGAALFYGDGVITPAISVLSAVEGLQVATPLLKPYVIPITLAALIALFMMQKHGTAGIGAVFGPIMVVWFIVLAGAGLIKIMNAPHILVALNPLAGLAFCLHHRWAAFVALGAVVLSLTGAEALYADMGHFGARPIRIGWYSIVMPALVLNYFGQGALLIHHPEAIANPFYLMAPKWATLPLVLLATLAAVIASQAVISGAFSLTSQAIQLGYVPRMKIQHTSDSSIGQIYIPVVNWLLLAIIICIVLGFKSSDNLAAAYGIAVTTTMVITTMLVGVVMLKVWKWRKRLVIPIITVFMIVDLAFFGANLIKIEEGGWLPLGIGALLFFLLTTWSKGRQIVKDRTAADGIPLAPFLTGLLGHPPHRVSGTAVYLTGNDSLVPVSLLHNLKHNKVLHERTIFMTYATLDIPYVDDAHRYEFTSFGGGLFLLKGSCGFNETPDVHGALKYLEREHEMNFELMDTSFFLARETVVPTQLPGMSLWRERVFAWMHQNAAKPTDFFSIPANRVVELGTKIEI